MDLKLAVQARLPLIAVRTRDTVNVSDVLEYVLKPRTLILFGIKGAIVTGKTVTFDDFVEGGVYYLVVVPKLSEAPVDWHDLYRKLVMKGATLIVVNPAQVIDAMYDAGDLAVPEALLEQAVSEVVKDKDKHRDIVRALGGCTIKEAVETALLTMARDKALTTAGVIATRKSAFRGRDGLTQVYTDQTFYVPPKTLSDFAALEGPSFMNDECDPRLVPRGILAEGPAGTGKTSAAKWLAETWKVPLYRLDVGGTKYKYVGESERNNLANLALLDQMSPCVVLMDEAEKTYGSVMDHETSSSMFSQMLWWLAEHRSRVFTFMTTNDKSRLPPELYREGRIDQSLYFGGLEIGEAASSFVRAVHATFKPSVALQKHEVAAIVASCPTHGHPPSVTVTQSALTQAVYRFVKASA